MKPGMIITNYETIEDISIQTASEVDASTGYEDISIFKKNAEKEASVIIRNARIKGQQEYDAMISKAAKLLYEAEQLKVEIETNYEKTIIQTYNADTSVFLDEKQTDFKNFIENVDFNFNSIVTKAKNDIYEILLNCFESLFGELYDNPDNLKKLLSNNFSGFEDCKNAELKISLEAFELFNEKMQNDLESELDIKLTSVKGSKNLKGFSLNTNLGIIKLDLNDQLNVLKEKIQIAQ